LFPEPSSRRDECLTLNQPLWIIQGVGAKGTESRCRGGKKKKKRKEILPLLQVVPAVRSRGQVAVRLLTKKRKRKKTTSAQPQRRLSLAERKDPRLLLNLARCRQQPKGKKRKEGEKKKRPTFQLPSHRAAMAAPPRAKFCIAITTTYQTKGEKKKKKGKKEMQAIKNPHQRFKLLIETRHRLQYGLGLRTGKGRRKKRKRRRRKSGAEHLSQHLMTARSKATGQAIATMQKKKGEKEEEKKEREQPVSRPCPRIPSGSQQ